MFHRFHRAVCLLAVSVFCQATFPQFATAQQQPEKPLEFTRWSGTVNVPDPVAISLDAHGRVYVTQTQRRKANDLDIRSNRDWIVNDVSFQSVDEKRNFYHERLAVGADDPRNKNRVADLNNDGSHDYRDLMVLSEKIHLLQDTDGDGVADSTQVYAEGFQTEVTGIAAGVLYHDGDVYTTIAPDVWRLRDTDGDGVADQRTPIASGFGLHIAYGGHDMHGLTVGPDGRIYWSIGDKGISVTTADGRRFHYPNQGGVMRCNPDGTDFEVFAHGLRNVQELAFDQYGNLFGVDNDADQPSERERFVFIVPGMDAGWRCNYQYRGADYNPWTDEKLWVPWFDQQAAYIIPPISHSINGPAGFVFNPGTALSAEYKDYFFLTGAPAGEQIAFQVEHDGASFRMINQHSFGTGIPLVGINFGPDGALYGVDWGGGYPLNQTGAVWKIDVPGEASNAARLQVASLLKTGTADASVDELVPLLKHADQRIRMAAQFELVKRRQLDVLKRVAYERQQPSDTDGRLLARIHAIWGLGQLARSQQSEASDAIAALLRDADPEIRIQAARTIRDAPSCDGRQLLPLLADQDERVRFHALLALAAHPTEQAVPGIMALAEDLSPDQTYQRHALAMAAAACAADEQLQRLAEHPSSTLRMCAVLASRHQKSPKVAAFLKDADNRVATEAARAIHDDFSIPDALPALAAAVLDSQSRPEAFVRRAINAGFRLGRIDDANRLALFAANESMSLAMRLEALRCLVDWKNPAPLDRVTGRFRNFESRTGELSTAAVQQALNSLLTADDVRLQTSTMQVFRSLSIVLDEADLLKLVGHDSTTAEIVIEGLNLLAAQKSGLLADALQATATSEHESVRVRRLELLAETSSDHALGEITAAISNESGRHARQRAVSLLAELATDQSDEQLLLLADDLLNEIADSEIAVEVLESLELRAADNPQLANVRDQILGQLQTAGQQSIESEFSMCLTGGDADLGRQLFNTHLQAQCVRCHRIGKQGSTVGPQLDDIAAKRDLRYLLRAIVAPSADIEEKYRSLTVVLASGKTVQGLRVRETDDVLVLANNQGKEIEIEKSEIDDTVAQKVSIMPEMSKTLTPREIRDVLAYLKTLKSGR